MSSRRRHHSSTRCRAALGRRRDDARRDAAAMNVLVTGGAGYIGSHTCIELLAAGHRVVVLDNFDNSSPEALERVQRIAGRTLEVHRADLLDRDATDAVFASARIDAVIHFAGLKAV